MAIRRFEYHRPATLDEVGSLLRAFGDEARPLAGGTALVTMMKTGVLRPSHLIDLQDVTSLHELQVREGSLELGALTTIRTLELSPLIRERYGIIPEMASQVANVRIRNTATLGGTLSYGESQTDCPPALIALGAQVAIRGSAGERILNLEDLFLGPFETILQPDEILTRVILPALPARTAGCHYKFTVGSQENKPVANVSTVITMDGNRKKSVLSVRIGMGAVGGIPLRAKKAEEVLVGEELDENRIRQAATLAADEADPIEDLRGPVWYKRRIIRVLTERALKGSLTKLSLGG